MLMAEVAHRGAGAPRPGPRAPRPHTDESRPSGGAGVAASEGPGHFRVKSETSAKSLSGALAAQARAGTDPLKVQGA